jgi:hypothetical protein
LLSLMTCSLIWSSICIQLELSSVTVLYSILKQSLSNSENWKMYYALSLSLIFNFYKQHFRSLSMFSSIFSASVVIAELDETLLNYETWCFINLLSIARAGSVYQFVSFHLQLLQTFLLSLLSWEYFNYPNS